MPKARRRTPKKATARRTSRFVCGFKAAHAMGLGRHRTARHGVPSKKQIARGMSATSSDRGKIARLERRITQLERRYEDLVKGLRRATGTKR